MKTSRLISTLLIAAHCLALPLFAQEAKSTAASEKEVADMHEFDDKDWPQVYETSNGYEVAVHQPQIHEWDDYRRMTMRAALVIRPQGGGEDTTQYGAITVLADTTVDKEERVVFLADREVSELTFPNAPEDKVEALRTAVLGVMNPTRPITINLDRVLANVERNQQQENPKGISLAPPPIYFATEPTILVMFIGPAKFEQIEGNALFFGVNTNWDVFLDPSASKYYLLADKAWLTSDDVQKGPWVATDTVPDALAKLPDTEDWKEVKAALPAKKTGGAPKVVVTDRPSELILMDGKPEAASIPGTKILYLANTESDLFLAEGHYYFLTAGRWFRSLKPEGPWEEGLDSLPEDFAKIPEDHEKGHVLASVPNTPDAEEAIIMAQVPQTAEVNRKEATLEVKYDGEPKFVGIKDTTVKYATNTPEDVFQVDPKYYCCSKGVWFISGSAQGPWMVCDSVPDAIYDIPASSPKHNVTYVYVYNSTPQTVTVGYTGGYSGAYVVRDLLVFGAGLWLASEILDNWDDHWHHCHWRYHPSYYGYGCGARYGWHYGGYYRHGYRAYGPYGGAGFGAVYNPWTGGYARAGGIYGPRRSAYARSAYNPWTNTYGARVGGSTPYGKWGKAAVRRDDEWARAGYKQGRRGSVTGFETSKGTSGIKVNRRFGDDSFALKTGNDDLYVGKDGKLFKRDENGEWSNLNKGKWDSHDRMKTQTRDLAGTRPANPERPGSRPSVPTKPGTRPNVPDRPTTLPANPSRPTTQPSRPTTQPSRPTTQPSRPTTQPSRPTTQPSRPTTQPSRPTTQPSRPTTQPSRRPTTTQPTRSHSSQLRRDYSARQRGNSRTSSSRASRSSNSRTSRSRSSRSSGGRSRGR